MLVQYPFIFKNPILKKIKVTTTIITLCILGISNTYKLWMQTEETSGVFYLNF